MASTVAGTTFSPDLAIANKFSSAAVTALLSRFARTAFTDATCSDSLFGLISNGLNGADSD